MSEKTRLSFVNNLACRWNSFFFRPISIDTLGLFRIFFGITIFLSTLGRFPYREIFYSDLGIVTFKTMSHFFPPSLPDWLFFRWLPTADPALEIYFVIFLISIACFTFGFFTRTATLLTFAGLMSLSNRNFFIDNAGDDLMRINLFFLIFAPAGKSYSLDRYFACSRGEVTEEKFAPWAQRLIQLQLSFLYLNTVYLKLPGQAWKNGTALYYAFDYLELRRFDFKYMFYYLWQFKLATYFVMVAETAMFTLVWTKKFRYYVLAGAFCLHEGINLTMQFPVFQYVMMTSLIVFIDPEDLKQWIGRIKNRAKGSSLRSVSSTDKSADGKST